MKCIWIKDFYIVAGHVLFCHPCEGRDLVGEFMMRQHSYWVYMMMNHNNRVIYVGVTDDLLRRVHEHRSGTGSEFTGRYHVNKLVYAEFHQYIDQAIRREHQIKGWKREWKLNLISRQNPEFEDITTLYLTEAKLA